MSPSNPPHQSHYAGLDLLSTAVMVTDRSFVLMHANPAAENLFAFSLKNAAGQPLARIFSAANAGNQQLFSMLDQVVRNDAGFNENELTLETASGAVLHSACVASPADRGALVLEFHALDQQLKIAREEKIIERQQLNRELIRNLAHEIKNPLGGIRGSAQLLERELDDPQLREYTQVIIAESDRLQELMNRLLTSHRMMQPTQLNLHDVLERVRRLILAEFPSVEVCRDYDTSLPYVTGDREQLIQAILNIVRNAAQALHGHGEIVLRTRAARQITLAKRRFKLALELQVIDNGPGIPDNIRDKIFYPLVSGRENGSGLGLSLAQSFIEQHHGAIDVDSRPGRTCFTVYLPIARDSDA